MLTKVMIMYLIYHYCHNYDIINHNYDLNIQPKTKYDNPYMEGIMVWFAIGLMVGGFLGMFLMAIFAANRRGTEL